MQEKPYVILLVLFVILFVGSGLALIFYGTRYVLHPAHQGRVVLELEVDVEEVARKGTAGADSATRACAEVLGKRLNAFGVSRPRIDVDERLPHRLRIEMPAVKDLERVTRLLENPGVLELKLVEGNLELSREALLSQFGGAVPEGLEVACGPEALGGVCAMIREEPVITESDIERARPGTDQFNEPVLQFTLTSSAGDRFRQFTAANIGRNLAISLNGQLLSMPTIEGEIHDRAVIKSNFSMQEVTDLVAVLRSARLPAPVRVVATERIQLPPVPRLDEVRVGVAAIFLMVSVVSIATLVLRRAKAPRDGGPESETVG